MTRRIAGKIAISAIVVLSIQGPSHAQLGRPSHEQLGRPSHAQERPSHEVGPSHAQERTNIVFYFSDDHGWADSGAYGSEVVRTPNIDRLASEGMLFRQAFAATPTCTPSRAATYTGLMPARNGSMANKTPIRAGVKTLPNYFRQMGYRVVLMGKHMVYPEDAFPFEYIPATTYEPGRERGLYRDLVTAQVDSVLEHHDPEVPLFLLVASYSPHVQWPENEVYDWREVDLPAQLIDTKETRIYRTMYYTDVTLMDERLGEVMASVDRHGYRDNTLFVYASDHGPQFPFGKWSLYDLGIRIPLVIRWPGRVEAGARTDALVSLVDLLPTFIEAAGGAAPDKLDGLSFLPVLTGEAEQHREAVFASHTGDFLGGPDSERINDAPMRAVRTDRYKYIVNLNPETPYRTHDDVVQRIPRQSLDFHYWPSWIEKAETDRDAAMRIHRYRYRAPEELYDLASDPDELNNLAEAPRYRDVLLDLRSRLSRWRQAQTDTTAMRLR